MNSGRVNACRSQPSLPLQGGRLRRKRCGSSDAVISVALLIDRRHSRGTAVEQASPSEFLHEL